MQDLTVELIKNYIASQPRYSYKSKGNWLFGSKYIVLFDDNELMETSYEYDAIRMVSLLNSAAKTSFIDGAVKEEIELKYNSINFMRWTLSESCQYRTTQDICCPTCKIWFNIHNFNDLITTDELYQKWQNGVKKRNR